MFYQEALPKFRLLSRVDSLLTIRDRHWRKVATAFKQAESANSLPFARNRCLFMWGAYFCVSAYKRDVVVVIKMGAYLYSWGAYFVWVLIIPILWYMYNKML